MSTSVYQTATKNPALGRVLGVVVIVGHLARISGKAMAARGAERGR
jgi:hypothetical protein